MTTIHLGNCQNGCEICADNHHEYHEGKTCPDCNKEIPFEMVGCIKCGLETPELEAYEWDYLDGRTDYLCTPCYEFETSEDEEEE